MASPSAAESRRRRDWANLDAGPAGLIAERVLSNDIVDLVRFRAVCRPWRACSAHLRARGVLDRRFQPRRWIMLPDTVTFNDVHGRRCFMNVFTGERIYPWASPDPYTIHVIGSTSEGLVILLLGRRNTDVVQLLNPMTGQVTYLPPATKLLRNKQESVVGGDLRDAGVADDSTVVLRFESFALAVAKPGDKRWTHILSRYRITSVLPFAGRIYCSTRKVISVVQTMANKGPQLVAVAHHKLETRGPSTIDLEDELYEGQSRIFLVDKNGELIICHHRRLNPWTCDLYRVNLETRNAVPLATLNGHALFISRRRSLLVPSGVFQSINANTVYVCWPNVVAIDLSGGCSEPKFKNGDVAYYLACYVHKYIKLE